MNKMLTIEAVRKTVTVDCSVEEAFRVFTSRVASWWPTESHSIHGDDVADVVFEAREGGTLFEVAKDGETCRWATVVAFEPPHRLLLAWEVDEKTLGTEVEVRFAEQDGRTRVDLEHRGWENAEDRSRRQGYETGWDQVLGCYAARLDLP